MVVYWEYAFLENFAIDGVLLYPSLRCAHVPVRLWRWALASAFGAAEAVLFPLFALPAWCAYIVKFLGGAAIVLIALPHRTGKKSALFALAAFFLSTFAFGGALTALYSYFGVEYEEGNGFLVERAPVGLVLAGGCAFSLCICRLARAAYRYKKTERSLLECVLRQGERSVALRGFADSGNCLMFRGEPVCVVSYAVAFALFGRNLQAVGRMEIGTVNGGRDSPVLKCESMSIGGREFRGVYLTVGEMGKNVQIVLHTAFTEGCHEAALHSQRLAAQDKGERKRRTLSVRERGAASAAASRGGGADVEGARRGDRHGECQDEAHRA